MRKIICWLRGHAWSWIYPAPKVRQHGTSCTVSTYQPYERHCYRCGELEEMHMIPDWADTPEWVKDN